MKRQDFLKQIAYLADISYVEWHELVLKIFRWQASENQIYRQYLSYLNINPLSIQDIRKIPFLPIEFFKQYLIQTEAFIPQVIFESSGTTGQIPSRNAVRDVSFYHCHAIQLFEKEYGSLSDYHILALLPSYLERQNSSLVNMINAFIQKTAQPSGFFLYEWQNLIQLTRQLLQQGKKVIVWGVSFALLDWAENAPADLSGCIIIETGGMKGRKKEIVREELHEVLRKAFAVTQIHAEYGMTELLSQAYAKQDGWFATSPYFTILLRDLYDPFEIAQRKIGGINIIDLANLDTCCFIETKDIGIIDDPQKHFKVIGRLDNSEIRGCNLMISS